MADLRGEPSMEDILASIRRIIAEDPAPAARTPTARKGASQPLPPAVAAHMPEPQAEVPESPPADIDFEATLRAVSENLEIPPLPDATEQAEAREEEEEVLELTEVAEDPAILSAATASAAAERLQHLSDVITRPDAGAMTLDALVREMLRPMLKDWLDANLADIVDQVVSREIARLTGKGQGQINR